MNTRTLIGEAPEHLGEDVTLMGFVRTVRDQKSMQFLVIYDQTGALQVVHPRAESAELAEIISSLTPESAVIVTGTLVANPNVKLGGIELQVREIEVANLAESPLPITPDSTLELRIDNRHLSLRYAGDQLTLRVQTTMERAMRDFWYKNSFVEIHSPKLLSAASEGGAELFALPYIFNGWTAYLAQSPQFYKQLAIAGGLDRVFEVGPVFRANPSFTSRHDTEFTSVDMELAWTTSHEDVMAFEEKWLAYAIGEVARVHGEEIREIFGVDVVVPQVPFPRITLSEGRKVLAERGHVISHKDDLDPEGERMLSDYILEKFGHEFVFVTDYPADVRAFYHMRHPDDPQLTMSFDLLYKGVEVTTGAQREHRVDRLMDQAQQKGISLESLEFYFNFFRHGCPPHGGCGVGLTRLLMKALGRSNVREVTFLYRGPNRLTP